MRRRQLCSSCHLSYLGSALSFHVAALSVVLGKAGTPRPSQGLGNPIKGGSTAGTCRNALTAQHSLRIILPDPYLFIVMQQCSPATNDGEVPRLCLAGFRSKQQSLPITTLRTPHEQHHGDAHSSYAPDGHGTNAVTVPALFYVQAAAFESSNTHLRLSRCAVVDVRTVGLTQFGRVRDLESCSVAFWWVLRISLARRLPSKRSSTWKYLLPAPPISILLHSLRKQQRWPCCPQQHLNDGAPSRRQLWCATHQLQPGSISTGFFGMGMLQPEAGQPASDV